MSDSVETIDSKKENDQKEPRNSRLRTGLLVMGSALLGGIAVAVWNRRSLIEIRNQPEEPSPKAPPVDNDAIY